MRTGSCRPSPIGKPGGNSRTTEHDRVVLRVVGEEVDLVVVIDAEAAGDVARRAVGRLADVDAGDAAGRAVERDQFADLVFGVVEQRGDAVLSLGGAGLNFVGQLQPRRSRGWLRRRSFSDSASRCSSAAQRSWTASRSWLAKRVN